MHKRILNILLNKEDTETGGIQKITDETSAELDNEQLEHQHTDELDATNEVNQDNEIIEKLKRENEELKRHFEETTTQKSNIPTYEQLASYTDDQWAQIEARTGKDRNTIMREFKDWEITQRQNELIAKSNVNDAVQDLLETNPKLLKLRGGIKEYLADVPTEAKLNPARLKREIEKAINYAKGKYMDLNSENRNNNNNNRITKYEKTPSPNNIEDYDETNRLKKGEVKDDVHILDSGLKIKTGKIDKKLWKRVQSPDEPNSVRIPMDFDEEPKFDR